MGIRSEGGLRPLQLEAPSDTEADRQVDQIIAIANVEAGSDGERAVQGKALTVGDHASPEISAEENAGIPFTVGIRNAGANTEVVVAAAIGIGSFEREAHTLAGVRKRGAELVFGERPIGRLEHGRSSLLGY